MKNKTKLIGALAGAVLTVFLLLTACSSSLSAPYNYSVIGMNEPIPSITAVVGDRNFEGSSVTHSAKPEDGNLAMTCSYKNSPDLSRDIQTYIQTLVDSHGFATVVDFQPEMPTNGAMLTRPSDTGDGTLMLTIQVKDEKSYSVHLESMTQDGAQSQLEQLESDA